MVCTARWKCRTQKIAKKSPSGHHSTTLSGYIFATKHVVSTVGKKLVKQQYLLHKSAQYGELRPTIAAEIVSLVWGTPANFNGFRVLASLLQRRRSTEANQTLHSVWPLPGLVHFRRCCSVTEFCQVQNSLCVLPVLPSPIRSWLCGPAVEHWSLANVLSLSCARLVADG